MNPKINKFGFEIEGEMSDELMNDLANKYGSITSDGSIRTCPWNKVRKYHSVGTPLRTNEFVSYPIEYNRKGIKSARDIFKLFNKYFKKKEFHWNKSMGFHLHLSFRPKMPVDIWSVQFTKFFIDEMAKQFKTMYVKRKDNTYCKVNLDEREIAETNDRYKAINFKPAFDEHGTIEFRIFPANRPMTMSHYLDFTIKMVRYFLKHSSRFCHKSFEFETTDEMENPSKKKIEIEVDEKKKVRRIERELEEGNNQLTIEK